MIARYQETDQEGEMADTHDATEEGDESAPPRAAQDASEEEEIGTLAGDRLRSCIEAILFAAAEPVPRKRLRRMLRGVDRKDIDEALLALEADYVTHDRGFGLIEDASGLQLLSKPEYAPYVARLRGERRIRLSQAAFESLAVIAYRQPMRRADLEAIRGVQSGAVLKNLMEWNLIQILGRDESTLGRPLLYGTTRTFLEQFGLQSLDNLPEPDRLLELGGQHGMEVLDDTEPPAGDPHPAQGELDLDPQEDHEDGAETPEESDD